MKIPTRTTMNWYTVQRAKMEKWGIQSNGDQYTRNQVKYQKNAGVIRDRKLVYK